MFRPALLILSRATTAAPVQGQPLPIRTSPDAGLFQRLAAPSNNRQERAEVLARRFEASGCAGQSLTREAVKGLKEPNIV
jgi:hypothetical protein